MASDPPFWYRVKSNAFKVYLFANKTVIRSKNVLKIDRIY